jgi:hypothetical protein
VSIAQRRKGRAGEQKLARILRAELPEIAEAIRRGQQSRVGSDDPDVCGLPLFWVEHKCGKLPNIRAALEQAHRGAKGRAMPLAVVQDDRARDRLVCLHLTDFLRVLRAAYGYTPPLCAVLAREVAE